MSRNTLHPTTQGLFVVTAGIKILAAAAMAILVVETSAVEPPATIYGDFDFPIWVSAEAARGEDSFFDPSLFSEHWLESLNRHVSEEPAQLAPVPTEHPVTVMDPEDCVFLTMSSSWTSYEPFDSFSALAAEVQTALKGTIVASTPGFYLGTYATLFTVRIERLVSSEAALDVDDLVYVAYPRAAFKIGHVSFCGHHRRGAVLPVEVGSELVLFSLEASRRRAGETLLGLPELMALTDPEGTVLVGEDFLRDEESSRLRTLDELFDRFENFASKTHRSTE